MVDILVNAGQFLSVMGLVYGLMVSFTNRPVAQLRRVRATGHDAHGRGRRVMRPHRAASRAVVAR